MVAFAGATTLLSIGADHDQGQRLLAETRSLQIAPHRSIEPAVDLEQRQWESLLELERRTTPYGRADFGAGTQAYAFSSTKMIINAYSWHDGTLLVVLGRGLEPGVPSALALLNRGNLRAIPLPPVPNGKCCYDYIDLYHGRIGDDPIVEAGDRLAGSRFDYLMRLRSSGAYDIIASPRGVREATARYALSSGLTCAGDDSATSPVAVWAMERGHRRHPLVLKTTLLRASDDLIDTSTLHYSERAGGVRCLHLGRLDLLNVVGDRPGNVGVVFAIHGSGLTLLARGVVLASGEHKILIAGDTQGGGPNHLEVDSR